MGVPEKSIIQGEGVWDLIPQRPPIVMIDKVFRSDETSTKTGLLVKEDNIFCKNGYLQESGLVENIAQSAAARIGYFCKMSGVVPPVGFIGAIKSLKVFSLPVVGCELITEIVLMHEVLECNVISGKVTCNNKPVAECEMKVFIQKDM